MKRRKVFRHKDIVLVMCSQIKCSGGGDGGSCDEKRSSYDGLIISQQQTSLVFLSFARFPDFRGANIRASHLIIIIIIFFMMIA